MKKALKIFFFAVLFVSLSTFINIYSNNSVANSVAIDNNNKIVAGGYFLNSAGDRTNFALARYNTNGTLDTTFNAHGPQPGVVITPVGNGDSAINWLVIDNNNKIVVAGFSQILNTNANVSGETFFTVARYNPDGLLDSTFNAHGPLPGVVTTSINGVFDEANSVVIDNNNKIVVTGSSNNGIQVVFATIRYNPNGSRDTTFGTNGIVLTNVSTLVNNAIPAGSVNNNLNFSEGVSGLDFSSTTDVANAVTIDNNNKIVVAGYAYDGRITDIAVVRYNPNGTLDTSFNSGGLVPGIVLTNVENNAVANDVKIDNNNKIVVGGFSNQLKLSNAVNNQVNSNINNNNFTLVRYNPNGSLDTTFNPAPTAVIRSPIPGVVITLAGVNNNQINSLLIDSNNKIVASGFANNNNNNQFATARYNNNGTLDTTFNPNGTVPGIVITDIFSGVLLTGQPTDSQSNFVVLDNNNKLVEAGYSTDEQQNNFTIVRYNNNGSLDCTFRPKTNPATCVSRFLTQANADIVSGIEVTILTNGLPQQSVTPSGFDDWLFGAPVNNVMPSIMRPLSTIARGIEPPVILSPEAGAIMNDVQPSVSGTSLPGKIVTLKINGMGLATTMADLSGQWMATLPPLADGEYSLEAETIDPVGSITLNSPAINFSINTQPPASPIITSPRPNSFTRNTRIAIEGNSNSADQVALYINNNLIGTVNPNRNGKWNYRTSQLPDGKYNLYAVAVNSSGTVSLPSAPIDFVIDSTPPRPPLILTPENGTVTANAAQVFSGEAKPNIPVQLLLNNKRLATVEPNAQGKWSYTAPSLAAGSYTLIANSKDPLARAPLSSIPIKFKIISKNNKQPSANLSFVNSNGISGVAKPKDYVTIFIDGIRRNTVRADVNGKWSYSIKNISQTIAKGAHDLTVAIADGSKNIYSMHKLPLIL